MTSLYSMVRLTYVSDCYTSIFRLLRRVHRYNAAYLSRGLEPNGNVTLVEEKPVDAQYANNQFCYLIILL